MGGITAWRRLQRVLDAFPLQDMPKMPKIISGFFTKKNSDVIIYIEYERGCLRWKNSSDPHADGLTGDTREMQEKRTPAK